jgi:hypothetical protein
MDAIDTKDTLVCRNVVVIILFTCMDSASKQAITLSVLQKLMTTGKCREVVNYNAKDTNVMHELPSLTTEGWHFRSSRTSCVRIGVGIRDSLEDLRCQQTLQRRGGCCVAAAIRSPMDTDLGRTVSSVETWSFG